MRGVFVSAAVCAVAALSFAGPVSAGCRGSGCYQQVVNPPVYETRQHDLLVAPERHIARRIPAEYGTVEETVVVRGARQIAHHVPAEYSTVNETVLVSHGGRQWQVSTDAYGQTVGCWVDVPPQYATRQREVQVRAADTVYETIPAEYATRQRTVLTRPSGIDVQTIPAQYETVSQQVQVAPATVSWQPLGGGYGGGYRSRRSCGGLFGGNCGQ